MKSMLKLPLVAVALSLAAPFTFAQDQDAPPPPPAGERGGQFKGGPGGDRLKMLSDKLGLTEEQKTKVKAILEDEMQKGKALREDKSLDRDAAHAKMQEIRKTHREQIRAVLTPEQQKKFDEMKEDRGPGGPRKEKAKE